MDTFFGTAPKDRLNIRRAGAAGIPMRVRLFGFLTALVLTLLIFVLIILFLTGTFTAGTREAERFCAKELESIAAEVEKEYGYLSASAVDLADSLARSMERFLSEKGIGAAGLSGSPEILEEVLDREFDRLLVSVEKTGASGAFLVLDATVSKGIGDAEPSRAGLYLKNMEPNAVSAASPTVTVLRGFPDIARSRGYSLHAQWDMEFAINRPPYFFLPLEKAEETMRPLSRLYYWSEAAAMPGTSETAMICAVPLIDSNGGVFGVCGYEVSAMLFKLKFMPDNAIYRRIFCMLAPEDGPALHTKGALFSGSYDAFGVTGDAEPLLVKDQRGLLFSYGRNDGTDLIGIHKSIKLYPEDSVFAQDRFTLGLFMPREDLDRLLSPLKIRWIAPCVLFLLVGIGASVFISNRYIDPIAAGLAAIGSQDIDSITGTNIAEIDEIIGQIKARRKDTAPLPDNLFEDFIARVRTLTPTEKTIFRHYSDGRTNSEILSLMYISLSTFKTHNSHIYNKLGISSREELLLYVKLIQKSGRLSEIE